MLFKVSDSKIVNLLTVVEWEFYDDGSIEFCWVSRQGAVESYAMEDDEKGYREVLQWLQENLIN